MTRLAIFDCDGTLVDSGATIHRALRTALDAHGIECPPNHVTRRVIGLSLVEAMASLVPDGDHHALAQTYKVHSSRCAVRARSKNRCTTGSSN